MKRMLTRLLYHATGVATLQQEDTQHSFLIVKLRRVLMFFLFKFDALSVLEFVGGRLTLIGASA